MLQDSDNRMFDADIAIRGSELPLAQDAAKLVIRGERGHGISHFQSEIEIVH